MSDLPEEMWFGKIRGQWPIYCWESPTHAMSWLSESKPEEHRKLWKARLVEPVEYEAVRPEPYLQQRDAS